MIQPIKVRLPSTRIKGFIARPDVTPAPGILVLHEINGIDKALKDACERLVAEYTEAAGRLAFGLEPVPMSPGAEDRLLLVGGADCVPGRRPRDGCWFVARPTRSASSGRWHRQLLR